MFPRAILLMPAFVLCFALQTPGQVVQLPTFRSFSIGTTVVIPDRGSAYLGGVNRARYGSVYRGVPVLGKLPGVGPLFRNRASASSVTSSGVHASATIIDLRELDKAVLAEAARRRGATPTVTEIDRKAAFLSRHVARRADRSWPAGKLETPRPSAVMARSTTGTAPSKRLD
jgi:type II secretory pathway component GspD/PulD (secretin)